MNFVRINLAEIMVEDLIGYPNMEIELDKDGDSIWVLDKTVSVYTSMGYKPTGKSRMTYAKPKWIQGMEDKPILLFLDDFNRALPNVLQSVMTIIDEHKYISWELPKGSSVILSSNHDDGEMFVTTQDGAQSTRYLEIEMKPSVDAWAEWAEGYGVDGRCINFLLKTPEIIEGMISSPDSKDDEKLSKGNLRLWTKFFDAISGFEVFEDNIPMILKIGSKSLPETHVGYFMSFIKNNFDKLPTPSQLLKNDTVWSIGKLKSVIGEENNRRQDIAAIMSKRLLNYSLHNHESMTDEQVENYAKIIESDLLTPDLVILTVRKLNLITKFKRSWIKREKLFNILMS